MVRSMKERIKFSYTKNAIVPKLFGKVIGQPIQIITLSEPSKLDRAIFELAIYKKLYKRNYLFVLLNKYSQNSKFSERRCCNIYLNTREFLKDQIHKQYKFIHEQRKSD